MEVLIGQSGHSQPYLRQTRLSYWVLQALQWAKPDALSLRMPESIQRSVVSMGFPLLFVLFLSC